MRAVTVLTVIVVLLFAVAFTGQTGDTAEPKAKPTANVTDVSNVREKCKHARKAVTHYRGKYHSHRARMGAGRPTTLPVVSTAACSQVRFLAYMWRSRAYVARVSADALVLFRAIRERQNREARERRQLYDKWECIHKHEGAWNDPNPPYYGGLQMDMGFQRTYGSEFMRKWGTADRWPVWAQIKAAERAYHGYNGFEKRGFGPWPNTRRMCGV